MLTVSPAQLFVDKNGMLLSTQFDDHYFSSAGGINECEHVFINGNNLLTRWKSTTQFTIAELGFGLGINFFTTANAWISNSNCNSNLHYISIEKFPISINDLQKIHSQLGICSALRSDFYDQYPPNVIGWHRIHFDHSRITLTLIFSDALKALSESNFKADAWYLDGFAPNKNPQLWSKDIAKQIFRLTRNNGSFATYSVAKEVHKNYTSAGFKIIKQKGFANKREMLAGIRPITNADEIYSLRDKSWLITASNKIKTKHAIVIGGGFAGVATSAALAKRNWQVTLIDKHPVTAMEGSGNANAILMPRLSVDHDIQAQLTLLGFLYSVRYLNKLQAHSDKSIWRQCGAIQLPRDQTQWRRMQKIASQKNITIDFLRRVNKKEASELCNCELVDDGWYFPQAGWLIPKEVCSTLQHQYADNISFVGNTEITVIEQQNSIWRAYSKNGSEIANAEVVILANALSANSLTQTKWCTLHPKRGQLTLIPSSKNSIHPKKIICAETYITPKINNNYVIGASFITGDTNTDLRTTEHLDNITKLRKIIPSFTLPDMNKLEGRAAIRAVSPDRLPIVGPVANKEDFNTVFKQAALGSTKHSYSSPTYLDGLYLATGFGSRGMAWIPLCAEALACQINNEPNPLSQPILNAIHPNRILMKQLIKSVQ